MPNFTEPESGDNSPKIIFSNVVFPAPFSAIMPILSPRIILQERFSTRNCEFFSEFSESAKTFLEIFFKTATIFPLFSPASICKLTLPKRWRRSARCWRNFSNLCTRKTARVRRASTPLRIQISSSLSFLSKRSLALVSSLS